MKRIDKKIRDTAIDCSRFMDWLFKLRTYLQECVCREEEVAVIEQLKESIQKTGNRSFRVTRMHLYVKFAKGELEWVK